MNKELKYGGYSASPNDHDAVDGDLAVCMNLIPEHGTIRPVLPPSVIAHIPGDPGMPPNDKGRKVLCIHKTSAYEHYIVAIKHQPVENHPHYWYLYQWDGTESGTLDRLGMKSFYEIYKVEPVGNTLVVLTDTGLHYYLWKEMAYKYLGTHIPELDIQFSAFGVRTRIKTQLANGVYEFELGDDKQFATAVRDKETRNRICTAAVAALNATVRGIANKKLFMFPFFVRYAFRLYDGSLTMHSAPILIALPNDVPAVEMVWEVSEGVISPAKDGSGHDRFYGCTVDPIGYVLCKRAIDEIQLQELEEWSDIISKVSIFISPQFYTYEADAKNDDIIIGEEITRVPAAKNRISQISDNANFYLAAEYDVDKINDTSKDIPWSPTARDEFHGDTLGKLSGYSQVTIDFEPTNDNIVTRPVMTDDYQTHDEFLPSNKTSSFAYNNRINLANINRRLFNGFSPCCFWFDFDESYSASTTTSGRHGWAQNQDPSQATSPDYNAQSKLCTCTVVVKKPDGSEVVMASKQRYMYFYEDKKILWFFYPDESAVRAYFDIDGDKYEINLKKHSMLNGAYFLSMEVDMEQTQVDSIPTPSTPDQRLVAMPNKVYTSEVNNPFYFPVTGINSIGSGNIMGICAAVRPVSTGQMGYADLYIFADSGVWTAKINEKGTYSNVTLATGDVCINADSITQMETSVLFTTDRGIMLISGSQAQCISEIIDDDGSPAPGLQDITDELASFLGMQIEIGTFKDFMRECRMIYDYTGQRIIVYNRDYSYAYIYSLESNKWGMMQSNIDYSVRAYPESLAVDKDGNLVNCTVGDGTAGASQLLITRPVTLDAPDVLKTVTAVLQRGLFRKGSRMRNDRINAALYGTRDLYNWDLVMTSRDENMRGRRGTPYKWFRIALMMRLPAGESVTGCSVQFDPRYTNRLR